MDIKTLWGFRGDATKLNADSPVIKAGTTFTNVDERYGRALVGKGLAMEIDGAAPQENKAAKPAEQPRPGRRATKPAAPAEDK